MRLRSSILLLALPCMLAACASGRGAASGGGADTGQRAAAEPTEGPDAPGGRWYGYEGGLDEAEKSAATVLAASQYWRSTEGLWSGDAASGTYVAHHGPRWLRRLEVVVDGATTSTGAYTYDETGRLYFYGGEVRRRMGTGRNARVEQVALRVALDGRGNVGAAAKTVNGRAEAVSPAEVERIVTIERAARAAVTAP